MNIKSYIERDAELVRITTGKKVLHLGCVGTTDGTDEQKILYAGKSLHALISKSSSDCIGVDLDGSAINELRDLGVFSNVIQGDVEKLECIPQELLDFDIVLAGDIIEHLSNPGLMLEGCKSRMNRGGGRLVISTPNSFGAASYLKYLSGRFSEGAQHVLCFNPITLKQLLERHGFEVIQAHSCYQSRAATHYGAAFGILRTFLEHFPSLGGTLLYVCRLKGQD